MANCERENVTNTLIEYMTTRAEIEPRVYSTSASARAISSICEACNVRDACDFYFRDTTPLNIRRYLWRLRMETLEEKALNNSWKWICVCGSGGLV
jgi:hypothetical protein